MVQKQNEDASKKEAENETKNFALGKENYIVLAISVLMIILGFILMAGSPNGEEFNPDIFSTKRTVIAPTISFLGFLLVIFAILWNPKKDD